MVLAFIYPRPGSRHLVYLLLLLRTRGHSFSKIHSLHDGDDLICCIVSIQFNFTSNHLAQFDPDIAADSEPGSPAPLLVVSPALIQRNRYHAHPLDKGTRERHDRDKRLQAQTLGPRAHPMHLWSERTCRAVDC